MPSRIILVAVALVFVGHLPAIAINADHVTLDSSDDGEGAIFIPGQVEESPDGNFYVLDLGDSFIKIFSPTGKYLAKVGGEGEGPGEFQRTDGANFGFTGNGKLFFTEFIGGHRWVTIMELNGDVIDVLSPQLDVYFGVQNARSLNGGSFLVQFAYNSTPQESGDYFLYNSPRSLALMDSSGVIVSEIVSTDFASMISFSSDGGTTNLPFTPTFTWALLDNNDVIWSDGMSPNLQVLDFQGKVVREIETPLPYPEKVTQSELQQWKGRRKEQIKSRNPVWWNRFGRVVQEYKKPLYDKPVLHSISTTPSGYFLVHGMNSNSTGFIYWLLDENGKEIAGVDADASSVHFSKNHLLFVTYDEEEIPQIHALRHFGDEENAIVQMGVLVKQALGSLE